VPEDIRKEAFRRLDKAMSETMLRFAS
jgi:hypothetical protein